MTRPRTTYGKRDREQQKREKAKAKSDRRAARQEAGPDEDVSPAGGASESELVEQLATLHRAFEAGDLPLGELEERQEQLRAELQRLQR